MGMLKYIFTNKYFYIWSLVLILFGSLSLFIVDKLIMPYYTNYNEGVTIPDVTRISLEEAEDLLTRYGLRYEVTDRRANSAFPADYVIDQSPSAKNIVKPNRKVYLTVNTEIKPQVVVPNVVDLSLRNAEIQLQNYGLEVGSRSYETSRFKTIIRQSIPEGTTVQKGTVIDLVVGDGLGSRIVNVPEITGLQLSEAQLKLREAGLRVDAVQFRPTRNISPNTVLDFSPKQEQLREGESLTLIISERFEVIEESEDGAVIIDSTVNRPNSTADSLNNQPEN
jgi:beta-lactam-binding protein with PASTA domain